MCQKQHGAAFATYASLPKSNLVYVSGKQLLASYNSSNSVNRKFCSQCGSNISWEDSAKYPGRISVALSTLDTPYQPKNIIDIYTKTNTND